MLSTAVNFTSTKALCSTTTHNSDMQCNACILRRTANQQTTCVTSCDMAARVHTPLLTDGNSKLLYPAYQHSSSMPHQVLQLGPHGMAGTVHRRRLQGRCCQQCPFSCNGEQAVTFPACHVFLVECPSPAPVRRGNNC